MKSSVAYLLCLILPLAALAQPAYDVNDPPQGLFFEEWLEVNLMGQKVGYSHITLRRSGDQIKTENEMVMKILRGDVALEISTSESTTETLAGVPLAFGMEMNMAGQPMVQQGTISDGKVTIKSEQAGRTQSTVADFPEGALMSWGLTRTTQDLPLEAGASFTGMMYVPSLSASKATQVEYKVLGEETVVIHGVSHPAWKAEMVMKLGSQPISTTVWVNEDNRTLKSIVNVMGMPIEMLAVDEATALSDFHPAEIFESNLVQLNEPIPEGAQEVVYQLSQISPDLVPLNIPKSEYQQVAMIGKGKYRITVTRPDFDKVRLREFQEFADNEPYLTSNLILDTQDPKIISITQTAVGKPHSDQIENASNLRAFVSDYIEDKNLTVGFATASEVAASPEGDCSEHAVLLAAMGRVEGIPTRVAAGLVYLPRMVDANGELLKDVMGYHMWTQFFLNGHWVDFDAALGESECSPIRIALMTSSLRDSSISELGLELLNSIGQINIEVISVK